jgi:hypothetical protein
MDTVDRGVTGRIAGIHRSRLVAPNLEARRSSDTDQAKSAAPASVNPHVGAALVPREPAFDDRTVEAGPVLARIATRLQERRVDQLDKDAAVLLDRARDLDQLTSGDISSGEGAVGDKCHCCGLAALPTACNGVKRICSPLKTEGEHRPHFPDGPTLSRSPGPHG